MIVATDSFNMDDIHFIVKSNGDIRGYVASLVPDKYRHVEAIAHNTRYLLNLQVLKSREFTLQEKTWISSELTKNIHVVGYMDVYITCGEMERHINMKEVDKYFRGEKYGKSG